MMKSAADQRRALKESAYQYQRDLERYCVTDRELDALVAEKVMGLEVRWLWPGEKREDQHPVTPTGRTYDHRADLCSDIERYSTDISAAMAVVSQLESQHYQWSFHRTAPVKSMHDNKPHAAFWKYRKGVLQGIHCGTADTLPRAICLAALSTVEEKISGIEAKGNIETTD